MALSLEAQGMSLEEILSQHDLKREDLERECPKDTRLEIALKLTDWKITGRYLGIPEEKLVAIERDNNSEEDRRIALLEVWNQREDERATYIQLMSALSNQGRQDLVNFLCAKIKISISIITRTTYAPGKNQQTSSKSG